MTNLKIKLYGSIALSPDGAVIKVEKRTEEELQAWRDGKVKGYEIDAEEIFKALCKHCCFMTLTHLRNRLIKG